MVTEGRQCRGVFGPTGSIATVKGADVDWLAVSVVSERRHPWSASRPVVGLAADGVQEVEQGIRAVNRSVPRRSRATRASLRTTVGFSPATEHHSSNAADPARKIRASTLTLGSTDGLVASVTACLITAAARFWVGFVAGFAVGCAAIGGCNRSFANVNCIRLSPVRDGVVRSPEQGAFQS